MMYRLYINGEFACETLCPMPDWELSRHQDVESAYVDDGEGARVTEYDPASGRFVRCEK